MPHYHKLLTGSGHSAIAGTLHTFTTIALLLMLAGCTKSAFLSKKPSTDIVVPTTLDDMNSLLDNIEVMNYNTPASGILSSDEYYYSSLDNWNALRSKTVRNWYIWNKDIYQGEKNIPDWNAPYQAILYANVVLESWDKLQQADQQSDKGKFVKACALFARSYNYFSLAETFAPLYDAGTATQDPGLPLRTTPDITVLQPRASVQETYDLILSDLRNAIGLFSNANSGKYPNRPSRSAAWALQARIRLFMRDYPEALKAADSSLAVYDNLLDYNTVDLNAAEPFPLLKNPEMLYFTIGSLFYSAGCVSCKFNITDTALTSLYQADDLRKQLFFIADKGAFYIKSGYNGTGVFPFTGLAVDEVYMIKSESQARTGDLPGAMNTLNKLLVNRYKTGTYIPYTTGSASEVLNLILTERRKELVWRGQRWHDLKRFNKEGSNIVLTRILGPTVYTLPPNDPRYIMPIPDDEIALSHIQQNKR